MNSAFLKDFIRYKKYQYLVSKDKDNEKKILDNKNFNEHKNLLNSLKKNGYFLIPNFLPKNECSDLIKIIDKFIENYEQSKLMTKGYYEEGLKHGTWIFYDNGIPTEKESYKLGKKNGIYIDYYSSGEVRTKGWYKDNMKDSVWLNFNYYGDTTWTETYIMDKLVSED